MADVFVNVSYWRFLFVETLNSFWWKVGVTFSHGAGYCDSLGWTSGHGQTSCVLGESARVSSGLVLGYSHSTSFNWNTFDLLHSAVC